MCTAQHTTYLRYTYKFHSLQSFIELVYAFFALIFNHFLSAFGSGATVLVIRCFTSNQSIHTNKQIFYTHL